MLSYLNLDQDGFGLDSRAKARQCAWLDAAQRSQGGLAITEGG